MGGSTPAAARRAARLSDYFYTENREIYGHFAAERERLGLPPVPFRDLGTGFLAVSPDPDAEWRRMAPFVLHECNSYGRWSASAATSSQYTEVTDASALRASGLYPILRPPGSRRLHPRARPRRAAAAAPADQRHAARDRLGAAALLRRAGAAAPALNAPTPDQPG